MVPAPADPHPDPEGGGSDDAEPRLDGIPEQAAEAVPQGAGPEEADDGTRTPLAELPRQDFWDALYQRRSIRRFRSDPVPRELVEQVLHAGIWAPSSCNYQMWDLVAVDDPEVNGRLGALSTQMANAPVNVVVAYGRNFSEENFANVQSASALIQNMSLAAQVLGLGSFWITQTGDPDAVRREVGLPEDRWVVAVLALGYPKAVPPRGPKRRPLAQVAHWNHYAGRAIPSSADPEAWEPDLLAIYQRARVLNGLRHNKPRAWETRALVSALERLLPGDPAHDEDSRWLDVLPCTGILTERLARERRGHRFDVVERTPEVAAWCAKRAKPAGTPFVWTPDQPGEPPEEGAYAVVSCLFRLEGLRAADRAAWVQQMARWLQPGGQLLIGFVSARSFHEWTERLRARRGGPGGVEYVLSPDPNIGPFQALDPREVEGLAEGAGLEPAGAHGCQVAPQAEEVAFRTRNFPARLASLVRGAAGALRSLEALPGAASRRGRFQFRLYRKP